MAQYYRHLVAVTDESGHVWGGSSFAINCKTHDTRTDSKVETADVEQLASIALLPAPRNVFS
jgi:hypothetical protein